MIIGICGKARSGKDTIANYLHNEYGFKRMALADPLKFVVQEVFALDTDNVWDPILREQPLKDWPGWTVRKLLQFIGTDLFRDHIDKDIWVKSLCLKLAKEQTNYVVSDIRFPNERSYILDLYPDSSFIKVVRPGYDGTTLGGISMHASESYDLETNYTIYNDKELLDLYTGVDNIMQNIGVNKNVR